MARTAKITRKAYAKTSVRTTNHPVGGQNAGMDEIDIAASKEGKAISGMPRRLKKSENV